MRNRKGQSILEYLIILAALVVAFIFVATNFIQPGVKQVFNDVSQSMQNASGQLP